MPGKERRRFVFKEIRWAALELTLLPMPEIESVHTESSEGDAEYKGCPPFVSFGPITFDVLLECPMTHTQDIIVYRAVGPVDGIQ